MTDKIAVKNLSYSKTDITAGKKLDIATGVNLSDRFKTSVIKDSAIEAYGKTVYAMVTGATPAVAGQKTVCYIGNCYL